MTITLWLLVLFNILVLVFNVKVLFGIRRKRREEGE